jgi:hypothetical protein
MRAILPWVALLAIAHIFRGMLSTVAFLVLIVVESDPLDQPGDFLGRGSAFRDCGIHVWGFIFPRTVWLAYHGDCAGGRGAAFLSKQTVTSITFVTATHDIALIA